MSYLVSVLVRTKDRPTLLHRAIRSVCAQTLRPIEIIVVNDGSAEVDSLSTMVEETSAITISVIDNVGTGRSAAANTALNRANGEFCLFLDDDDEIEPDHLQSLADRLKRNSTAVAAYSETICVLAGNKTKPIKVYDEPYSHNTLAIRNFLPIHSVLFRRSAANGARFDTSLNLYEDWLFWLQLSNEGNFIKVDHQTAVYHLDESGIGGRTDIDFEEGRKAFLRAAIPVMTAEQLLFMQQSAIMLFREQTVTHGLRLEIDQLKLKNKTLETRLADAGTIHKLFGLCVRVLRRLTPNKL
jgi:glycosyltransferase involved in cell wall biosynthesis